MLNLPDMRQNRGINCAGDSIVSFQNTKNTMRTAVRFSRKEQCVLSSQSMIVLVSGGSSGLYI